jgi:DNA-binding transcriptional MerR regulator
MITIQGFAKLCGCNAQTLRYYDRIGLLAPARVDEWTGYRYYEEEQAMQFVRIRNLQQADFSIEEIKILLGKDDQYVMAAFDRKVEEQKQKLANIRKIQRAYLDEMMEMRNAVNTIMNYVEKKMENPVLWQEFGLDAQRDTEIIAKVHEVLTDWITQCRAEGANISLFADNMESSGLKNVAEQIESGILDSADRVLLSRESREYEDKILENAKEIFARDGWEHVADWLDEVPDLSDCKERYFRFRVRENSPVTDSGFPTMMLAVMAAKKQALTKGGGITCQIDLSDDGKNHVTLMEK